MALYKKKDGKILEIPDDVPETRRNEILREEGIGPRTGAINVQPRKSPVLTDEQKEVQKRVKFERHADRLPGNSTLRDVATLGRKGILGSYSDEVTGALSSPIGAVKGLFNGKGFVEGGKSEYRMARDTERELQRSASAESPTLGTIAEVGGSLGPGGIAENLIARAAPRVASAVSRVAPRAALGVGGRVAARAAGSPTGRLAARAAQSPLGQAVRSGAIGGAINAGGENQDLSRLPGDLLHGAQVGAIAGGAMGALGKAGTHIYDRFKANAPENVENRAYSAIGKLLDRTGPEGSRVARRARAAATGDDAGAIAAEQVEKRIGRATAQGVDEIVADQSPSLRGLYGGVARNTGLDVANDIGLRSEARQAARQEKFVPNVTANAGEADAVAREVAIQQARKEAGSRDYNDEVMKKPFVWNDKIQDIMQGPNSSDDIQSGLRNAAKIIKNTYDKNDKLMDPKALGWDFNEAGDVVFKRVPNMESFDILKKGFDEDIGTAIRAGHMDAARRKSKTLTLIKDRIGENNPGWIKALSNQRDQYQKLEALDQGTKVLGRLKNGEAREVLSEIKNLPAHKQQEYKLGIIDALTRKDKDANPFLQWDNVYRSPEQKKVMEFAFGGKEEAQKFNRWVRRERNAGHTDTAGNTKQGSISSQALLAAQDGGGQSGPLLSALKGYAYGGSTGGWAGFVRGGANMVRGTTDDAQELMGRLLMSKGEHKGEKISEGIRRVGKRVAAREARRTERLKTYARGGQQLVSGAVASKSYGDDDE